jgi:co-chaperonin GroES (HSP10)
VIRPMRGQVVVRLSEPPASAALWTPEARPRDVRTHRGVVLAMGPPARTAGGVEVEPGFAPGDVVQFHFEHHQETATNMWTDGEPATWIPQSSVDGVWESERDTLRSAS